MISSNVAALLAHQRKEQTPVDRYGHINLQAIIAPCTEPRATNDVADSIGIYPGLDLLVLQNEIFLAFCKKNSPRRMVAGSDKFVLHVSRERYR